VIEQAIDLRFDLRSALHAQGEFKRILTSLQEAQRLAEVLDDQRRLGRVFGYLALTLAFMGDPAGALAAGHRALDIAEARAEIGLQTGANYSLGLIYCNLGDHRRAMEFNNRMMESLQGELIRERFGLPVFPAVYARHLAMLSLAPLGEFAEATARTEDGFRIAEMLNHPLSHLYLDMAAGFVNLYRGHLSEAIRILERGLILCEATGSRLIFGWVASYLGSAYARSGRRSDGVLLLEQGVETITSLTVNLRRSYVIGLLGEAYMYAGRIDDASRCAERALDLSRAQKERGYEAETLRLLGEIAAHGDSRDLNEAEDLYRQAMAVGRDLGMRPLLARCHWGLGRLYLRFGDGPTSRAQFRAAKDMFREMDMRFWLEQAETA
jgi:tetratricopeptide (TPR) repeat protein